MNTPAINGTANGSLSTLSTAAEQALVNGNLAALNTAERLSLYKNVCESLGLNYLTQPFEYIELPAEGGGKKLTFYCRKNCTDQLRQIRGISVKITSRVKESGLYIVTAQATTPDGRTDEDVGAVPIEKEQGEWKQAQSGKRYFQGTGEFVELKGAELANALMKAETKAKRRVTLAICGLSFVDESELETIEDAKVVSVTTAHAITPALPQSQQEIEVLPNPWAWKIQANVTVKNRQLRGCMLKDIGTPAIEAMLQKEHIREKFTESDVANMMAALEEEKAMAQDPANEWSAGDE